MAQMNIELKLSIGNLIIINILFMIDQEFDAYEC